MHKSETKGYSWLLKQGYSEEDIVYQKRKNPDFLTSDGKGFEVKRLYAKTVWFTRNQFEEIKNMKDVTLLVFANEKDEPILTFSTSRLKEGGIIQGIYIKVTESHRGAHKNHRNF